MEKLDYSHLDGTTVEDIRILAWEHKFRVNHLGQPDTRKRHWFRVRCRCGSPDCPRSAEMELRDDDLFKQRMQTKMGLECPLKHAGRHAGLTFGIYRVLRSWRARQDCEITGTSAIRTMVEVECSCPNCKAFGPRRYTNWRLDQLKDRKTLKVAFCPEAQRCPESNEEHPDYYYYTTLKGMNARTLNPSTKDYKNYGGKGILIELDFVVARTVRLYGSASPAVRAFKREMGSRPSARYTIHRVRQGEREGNYFRGEMEWASHRKQATERRGVTLIGEDSLSHIAKSHGNSASTATARHRNGWSPEDAATQPAWDQIGPEIERHRNVLDQAIRKGRLWLAPDGRTGAARTRRGWRPLQASASSRSTPSFTFEGREYRWQDAIAIQYHGNRGFDHHVDTLDGSDDISAGNLIWRLRERHGAAGTQSPALSPLPLLNLSPYTERPGPAEPVDPGSAQHHMRRLLQPHLGLSRAKAAALLDEVIARRDLVGAPVPTMLRENGADRDGWLRIIAAPESEICQGTDAAGQPDLLFTRWVNSEAKQSGLMTIAQRIEDKRATGSPLPQDSVRLVAWRQEIAQVAGHEVIEALGPGEESLADASSPKSTRRVSLRHLFRPAQAKPLLLTSVWVQVPALRERYDWKEMTVHPLHVAITAGCELALLCDCGARIDALQDIKQVVLGLNRGRRAALCAECHAAYRRDNLTGR